MKMDLATIWFLLWGLLWAVYFITDGFDFGIGALMPFLGRDDTQRRIMYNSMGPLWDGNEVWIITAGGVTFAAFPKTYAVMFSAFYSPLLLILFALIVRGVSFEFRSKVESPGWRRLWDICMFAGSFLPALLLGVAFANIFKGIPIGQNGVYQGTIFTLLNPYGLVGGILFLLLFLTHGALWLALRSNGELHDKAVKTAAGLWPILLLFAVLFLVFSAFSTKLYANYLANPSLFVIILITVLGLLGVRIFLMKKSYWKAWFSSALTIIGATFFGVIGLYPNMLPSSIDAAYSITVHNASSSPLTLTIMLVLAVIFVPIVLLYQIWSYTLFKNKVTEQDLAYDEAY